MSSGSFSSNRKDSNGAARSNWQQRTARTSQGQQQTAQSKPLANYTLPGVINYLTSEFTNLERFKIMKDLEMSEMKYKIVQLQSELNTMKYINEKQKIKIQALEEEKNERGESKDHIINKEVNIPEVDLSAIKRSRERLLRSINEVGSLIHAPTSDPMAQFEKEETRNPSVNEYEELIDDSGYDNFVFDINYDSKKTRSPIKTSFFSKYMLDNEADKLLDEKGKVDTEYEQNYGLKEASPTIAEANKFPNHPSELETEKFPSTTYESDTETIQYDESLKPDYQLFLKDEKFKDSKVFRSLGDVVVLNYGNEENENLIRVKTWNNKTISSSFIIFDSQKDFFGDISELKQVYVLRTHQEVLEILTVTKSLIAHVTLLKEQVGKREILTNMSSQNVSIISTDIIEFSHKTTHDSNSFGLVVVASGKKSAFFKLHEILLSEDRLSIKDIGNYNKTFFKSLVKVPENDSFQLVHWYRNDSTSDLHASVSPKQKKHGRTVSCNDISLIPYGIVLKLCHVLIKLNIYSKQFSILEETNSIDTKWHGTVSNFDLLAEPFVSSQHPNGQGYKLKIFDLQNRLSTGELIVEGQSVIVSSPRPIVVELSKDGVDLALYDSQLKFLKNIKLNRTSQNLIQLSPDSILIADSKYLNVYSITTLL